MSSAGWLVMVLSVGSVVSLVSYCLYRVLTLPPVETEEHLATSSDGDVGAIGPNRGDTKQCPHCHKAIDQRSDFCAHCGRILDA